MTLPFSFMQIVKLQFLSFNVEYQKNCGNDAVKVYDGSDIWAPRLGSFCGNALPGDIVSADNTVYVSFVSDSSSQGKGFEIKYTTVDSGKCFMEFHITYGYLLPGNRCGMLTYFRLGKDYWTPLS